MINRIIFTVRTTREPRVLSYFSKEQNSFFEKLLLHSLVNAELVKKLIFCVVKSSVSRLVTTPL